VAQYQRPRGTRDFNPDEMQVRKWVESKMREAISSYGYREVSTPTFEHTDLFIAKSGPQVVEQIYSFEDKGGREIALRPELTASVMRFYHSDMRNHPKPLRIFYFGNCFRYERPQKGRYREFWQMGLEYIGKRTPIACAEVISASIRALEMVGLKGMIVRVGHVSLLKELVIHYGADPETNKELMIAIDKKDPGSIRKLLENSSNTDVQGLIELITSVYDKSEFLEALGKIEGIIDTVDMSGLMSTLNELMDRFDNIYFDPSISRGLDYYDDMVFEIDAPSLGAEKQICGGGGYSLSSIFGSTVEGIGFGLGFDRIIVALGEVIKMKEANRAVYILALGDETQGEAFSISEDLRNKGLISILETSGRGMKKAISYAVNSNCSHLILVGEDELKRGTVSIKNLDTKEQVEVERRKIMDILNIT
jgi:histidyl-tRNA synthetase